MLDKKRRLTESYGTKLGEGGGGGGPPRVTPSRGWHPNESLFFADEFRKNSGERISWKWIGDASGDDDWKGGESEDSDQKGHHVFEEKI